jgi:amino acid transporter
VVALLGGSLIVVGFVVANLWFAAAVSVAVLVSTLTALIWYILAMICLYILRGRNPELFRSYRAPVYKILPAVVIVLSLFAALVYSGIDHAGVVIALAVGLYAVGLGYYGLWGRHRLQAAAPEELGAQGRDCGAERSKPGEAKEPLPDERLRDSTAILVLEWITTAVLMLVLAALAWAAVPYLLPALWRPLMLQGEILGVLGLLTAALLFVSVLALLHTRTMSR